MNIKNFKNQIKEQRSKNAMQLILLVLITAITLINYTAIENIKSIEKTVIVPINQSSQFWISEQNTSPNYLTSIAQYAVQLWQFNTPSTVDQNFAKLLELVNPKDYLRIKQKLKATAAKIKRYELIHTTATTATKINTKAKKIIIQAKKTQHKNNGKKTHQKIKLTIDYTINNATFSITNLTEQKL